MFQNFAVGICFILATSSSALAHIEQSKYCDSSLSDVDKDVGDFTPQKLDEEFLSSADLIDFSLAYKRKINPFFASNESDWFKAKLDFEKTDLVAGVGTNALWDLGVRKDADAILFADINMGPLKVQKYFLIPLALIARTPAEFFSFLALYPLPANMLEVEHLDSIFDYLNQGVQRMGSHVIRFDFLEKIMDRLKSAGANPATLAAVKSYFKAYLNLRYSEYQSRPLKPFGLFRGALYKGSYDFYLYFEDRYKSESIAKALSGIPREHWQFATPFSSLPAFKKLQKLLSHSHYFLGDITESNFYDKVAQFAGEKSFFRVAIAISNVVDSYESHLSKTELETMRANMFHYAATAFRYSFPSEIEIYETRGARAEHTFTRSTPQLLSKPPARIKWSDRLKSLVLW